MMPAGDGRHRASASIDASEHFIRPLHLHLGRQRVMAASPLRYTMATSTFGRGVGGRAATISASSTAAAASASSSRVYPKSAAQETEHRRKHFIVLVHGFMGVPSNWHYISSLLEERGASCPSTSRRNAHSLRRDRSGLSGRTCDTREGEEEDVVIMISQSNVFLKTRDGRNDEARYNQNSESDPKDGAALNPEEGAQTPS